MTESVVLTQISPRTWEHPADRAALNTLRSIPGFDEVVRKVAGAISERGLRHIFLANAVRTGPTQRPKLDRMLTEVLSALDWPVRPQLYVTQTPFLNAAAVGFETPFIVINSGALEELNDDEIRFLIAHEVGHIMSGHTTYRTIAILLLLFGVHNIPMMAGLALMPFQLALLEWYRKSELSSDRAGLLGTQDPRAAMQAFMTMAGGNARGDEVDLDAFMRQASEYELDDTAWDTVLKLLATALREHPFATVRAAELQRWVVSGRYDSIIGGDYTRRGSEQGKPLQDDFDEAAAYYGARTRGALDQLEGVFDRARDAFNEALDDAFGDRPK
jgi:Zn-dependent protease with chaperone function